MFMAEFPFVCEYGYLFTSLWLPQERKTFPSRRLAGNVQISAATDWLGVALSPRDCWHHPPLNIYGRLGAAWRLLYTPLRSLLPFRSYSSFLAPPFFPLPFPPPTFLSSQSPCCRVRGSVGSANTFEALWSGTWLYLQYFAAAGHWGQSTAAWSSLMKLSGPSGGVMGRERALSKVLASRTCTGGKARLKTHLPKPHLPLLKPHLPTTLVSQGLCLRKGKDISY